MRWSRLRAHPRLGPFIGAAMVNTRGAVPIVARYHGATPVLRVYRGSALVWQGAAIRDEFDTGAPTLWRNELCDIGRLLFTQLGEMIDGLGNSVGRLVSFVADGSRQFGTLLSNANISLGAAYCGAWGGTAPPNGLIGLLNGLPVFGPTLAGGLQGLIDFFTKVLGGATNPLTSVTSIIGSVPVLGDMARMIGLVPANPLLPATPDPLNFITDPAGKVLGVLTCGKYTAVGGGSEQLCFTVGSVGKAARIVIPDGLVTLGIQNALVRHPTVLGSDDGWIETQVAEVGSTGLATHLYRRYSNSGSTAAGVALQLLDGVVSLVRRVATVVTEVRPAVAPFVAGDVLRLGQTGDVHTVYRNGQPVTVWDDTGQTAARGAATRSIAMGMQGTKEWQGPRKFSPTLSYVEAA